MSKPPRPWLHIAALLAGPSVAWAQASSGLGTSDVATTNLATTGLAAPLISLPGRSEPLWVAAVLLTLVCAAVVLGWSMFTLRHAARRELQRASDAELALGECEARLRALEAARTSAEREQRQRHDEALLLAGVGAFDWELATGRMRWSGAWPGLLGYGSRAVDESFENWMRLCKPQDISRVQAEVQVHLTGRSTRLQTELRMRNAHGGWQWVAFRGQVAARAPDGSPARMLGTVTDIDAWRGAESALQAEHRLFETGPVVLLTLDGHEPHALRWASAPLPSVTHPAGVRGARLRLHEEDRSSFTDTVSAAQAYPGRVTDSVLRLRDEQGGWQRWRLRLVAGGPRDDGLIHGCLVRSETVVEPPEPQLQELVEQMGATQRFMQDLQRISELLQQCETEDRARQIVAEGAAALFPGWSGMVTLAVTTGHPAAVVRWGEPHGAETFTDADCWALRRHRTHVVRAQVEPGALHGESPAQGPSCAHFGDAAPGRPAGVALTVCAPLAVDGQQGGLHLSTRRTLDDESVRAVVWGAEALADLLELSLANLRLRVSLREQAVRDWMTGLYNRRWFDEALPRETRRAERGGDSVTLAMLDIDHFKNFNDTFGHEAGDEVIKSVSRQLMGFVRSYDMACRVGGEELALLMPRARLEDARARLDRLREQIADMRVMHGGVALPGVTVSIGIADSSQGASDELLRRADTALYAAKRAGRNRIFVWNPSLDMDSVFGTSEATQASPATPARL